MYNEFVIALQWSVAFAISLSLLSQCNDSTLDLFIDKAYYIYSGLKVISCVQTIIWNGLKMRRIAEETAAETLTHVQRDELPFILYQVPSVLFNWLFIQHS